MASSPSPSPSENQLILRSEVKSNPVPTDGTSLKSVISSLSHLISLVTPFCTLQRTIIHSADLSQQVQAAMESMLKMINEIDENSTGVMEDREKCKDNALERKRTLEEQKESFQKATFSVLDMLNKKDIGYNLILLE